MAVPDTTDIKDDEMGDPVTGEAIDQMERVEQLLAQPNERDQSQDGDHSRPGLWRLWCPGPGR